MLRAPTPSPPSIDVPQSTRIESLDLIRGVAALGILLMNSIAFALGDSATYRSRQPFRR